MSSLSLFSDDRTPTAPAVTTPGATRVPSAPSSRVCTRCEGVGFTMSAGFTSVDGTVYEPYQSKCYACFTHGSMPALDIPAILAAVLNKAKTDLRSTPPSALRNTVAGARAYYVWRMTRFHGGVDVTMPMGAMSTAGRDAYVKELDALVDIVAERTCGTALAAAYRWGNLLAGAMPAAPKDLPATAYANGPVISGDKPTDELLELYSEEELAELASC